MLAIITALADLLTIGDYTAPLGMLGWSEDSPIVDLILTARGH